MDFDSPDVAKDFPGLARTMSDAVEYEGWDKSKKKKDKKDSKKDKEKGYATLADSPDEESVESKSPGKGIKIKSFKLTSKKKDKDKDKKEVSSKPPSLSLVEKEKNLTPEVLAVSVPGPTAGSSVQTSKPVPVATTHVPPPQRRPFDGQGYKNSNLMVKPIKHKVKTSALTSSSSSNAPAVSSAGLEKSAEKKGLNVFLNAPVPLLLKKKDKEAKKEHKDKESKKEHSLPTAVKMKLKRGSKTSLEETSSSACEVSQSMTAYQGSTHPQLPEDPETIYKEIKKYEGLLEQAHAQVKSGKKVNRKCEEQLWELQMTLTQLKRKLRSVNALSATFNNLPPSNPTVSQNNTVRIPLTVSEQEEIINRTVTFPLKTSETDELTDPIVTTTQTTVASDPIAPLAPVKEILDFSYQGSAVSKPETQQTDSTGFGLGTVSTIKNIEPGSTSNSSTCTEQNNIQAPDISNTHQSQNTPVELELSQEEIHETLQIQVEVHSNNVQTCQENATPEDIFEQEIQSFDGREVGTSINIGKREINVSIIEKGKEILTAEDRPESCKSKSQELGMSGEDNVEMETLDVKSNEIDPDEGDYVYLKRETSHIIQEQEDSGELRQTQRPKVNKSITAPSIFDPFALPEFKTDEFIAYENEALILFNQQLQDEIVKEEEEIETLIQTIQDLSIGDTNSSSDLLVLDDDELVNIWQMVKFENDTLNEQVLNLKTMVANSLLEEFRLETRVKYLLKKRRGADGAEECDQNYILPSQ